MRCSIIALVFLLSACDLLRLDAPYDMSTRTLAANEYELIYTATDATATIEQFKGFFQAKARELCKDKAFRLRSWREESIASPSGADYPKVIGVIECVSRR